MVARFFIFIFTFVILKADKSHKLIIDNDAGGDDAVAILLALLNEKHFNGPQLIGLTTVKGNTKESNVYVNNQRILKVAERQDIPIYRGSRESLLKELDSDVYFGKDGLGDCNEEFNVTDLTPAQEKNAVSALIELSKAHPGELTVLTIGPLTNLAMAIRLDPDFLGRLAQLYIGAGHIQSDDYPTSEFNARFDVEAYHIVLGSANPDKVTVLPFSQVGMHLNISKSWRQETLGSIENNIVKAINKYEAVAIKKNEYWLDLDPAVVAVAIMQDLVAEYKFSKNKVGLIGDSRGIVLNEFADRNQANVRVAFVLKKENYVNFLMSVFSAGTVK